MTFLTGIVAPTVEGADGDLLIDVLTFRVYGPKAAGVWPATYRILGGFLSGPLAPEDSEGLDGDTYLATDDARLYAPKADGAWGGYTQLGVGYSVIGSTSPTQRINLRRGTEAQWIAANSILVEGEPGFVTDGAPGSCLKIGNGTDAWIDLDFIA